MVIPPRARKEKPKVLAFSSGDLEKIFAERVAAREGWQDVPAVRDGEVHEIKSALILVPGPVTIREGLPALVDAFERRAARQTAS